MQNMSNHANKGLGRIIAIQLTILMASFFIVELFLWSFFPVHSDSAHIIFKQNLAGLKRNIVYDTNEYGFRSLSMQQEKKPANSIRIFCLGASTTDQSPQNTVDTWCALLENKLNNEFHQSKIRIETAGFGRGGWKAIDLYNWARNNIKRFKPDIVITLMGINDLSWNGGPDYSYTGLEDALQKKYPLSTESETTDICNKYSQICRRIVLAKRRISQIIHSRTGKVLEWHSDNLPQLRKNYQQLPLIEHVNRMPDPIMEFSDAMDAMLSLLQDEGIEVLTLGQPVLWKNTMRLEEANTLWFSVNTPHGPVRPSGEWLLNEMQRYNVEQENIASRRGASYVDLDSAIPKTLEYYFDDCHYTDAGSNLVASVILPSIKKHVQLLLQK